MAGLRELMFGKEFILKSGSGYFLNDNTILMVTDRKFAKRFASCDVNDVKKKLEDKGFTIERLEV